MIIAVTLVLPLAVLLHTLMNLLFVHHAEMQVRVCV